jgi:iron(III) transport system ATP-binding protein
VEIRIRGVSKRYASEGKEIVALDDVDLTIAANQVFTLLGPSGCGKTTLLRCIVGLEAPDSGEIAIGGQVVWSTARGVNVPPEKRGLGMVFQTYAIWPHMDVFGNVAYPLQVRGVDAAAIRERVAKTLRLVKLEGFEKRPATKLSGGQQQRVALARALVAEPKVILFDEPLSNLDAKLREETRKELRSFLGTLGITGVYVTHDRVEALALSDMIAVMRAGRIVEIGTPQKIYFNADTRFVADFIGRANLVKARVRAQRLRRGRRGHALHPARVHRRGARRGERRERGQRPHRIAGIRGRGLGVGDPRRRRAADDEDRRRRGPRRGGRGELPARSRPLPARGRVGPCSPPGPASPGRWSSSSASSRCARW